MTTALDRLESAVRIIAETCIEQEDYFCQLDSVVGDGDFGYSLARGFERLIEKWDGLPRDSCSDFLQAVAMCLSTRIGGTSGPIWGTAFLRAATSLRDKPDPGTSDIVAMLRAAIEGIMTRGGAQLGDKTLLDALVPTADAIERASGEGAAPREIASAAAQAARTAAESTSDLVAKRGRASYSGERSVGSLDPGAVAVAVLTERIAAAWH